MTGATEDMFTPIHKGLRAMMYDLSSRVQTNDFAELAQTRQLTTDLEHDFEVARSAGCMICVFHHHASDEESVIFPAVRDSNKGLIESLIEDHHGLTRRELAITKSAHEILGFPEAKDRVEAGIRLNQAMNDLVGAYLVHMNREESDLVPHMRRHFTDPEMAAMRGRIMGGMPPDRLFAILGWMLPALNVTELTDLFVSVRRTAPPPLVEAASRLAAERVNPGRWAEVQVRLAK